MIIVWAPVKGAQTHITTTYYRARRARVSDAAPQQHHLSRGLKAPYDDIRKFL